MVLSNLTFTGTVIDGIYVSGSDHVTVSRQHRHRCRRAAAGPTAPGISLRSSTASTVSGNTSDHNSSHGILRRRHQHRQHHRRATRPALNAEGWQRNANGIDVIAPGNTVLRNVVHDNEDSGLQLLHRRQQQPGHPERQLQQRRPRHRRLQRHRRPADRQHRLPQLHQRHQRRGHLRQLHGEEQHRGRQRGLPGLQRDLLLAAQPATSASGTPRRPPPPSTTTSCS